MFRLAWKEQGHTLDELAFVAPLGIMGSCCGLLLNILCLIAQLYIAVSPIDNSTSVAIILRSLSCSSNFACLLYRVENMEKNTIYAT